MPTNLPSSFASAAAGQNSSRDSRGARPDGRSGGLGESSRRDGRAMNGTLTFRRSSTTPLGQASHASASTDASSHGAPPDSHTLPVQSMTSASGDESGASLGFSKDYLVSRLKATQALAYEIDVSRLCLSGWSPAHVNGNGAKGWGARGGEPAGTQEPDPCWNSRGNARPVSLQDLSPEEQEMFASDVNSAVKPPQHSKEGGHPGGLNGRKLSLSHGAGNNYGIASPTSATRPSARRRETTDSNPFSGGGLTSPTTGRFSRDDPSQSWFGRRSNEVKESEGEDADDDGPGGASSREPHSARPFGSLMRSNTSGSAGLGSLWPPSSATAVSPGAGGFGNFSFGNSAVGDKSLGSARGSRLAHLIPKDGSENVAGKSGEGAANPDLNRPWRSRPRTDTDPFGDDVPGSAALRGSHEHDPLYTQQSGRGVGTGAYDTPLKSAAGDFGSSALNRGGLQDEDNRPISPSETNPYRSPPAERGDGDDHEDMGLDKPYAMGEQPSNYSTLSRGFAGNAFDGSDRSQTSSVGPRAYPSLSNLGGWPAPTGPTSGTPDRDRPGFPAFGNSIFSPMGDLQSPGLGSIGNPFASSAGIGVNPLRGSKLGSLFPPSMQAQMNAQEHDGLHDSLPEHRQANPLGAIGRTSTFGQGRETDSPMRAGRGAFEDFFASAELQKKHGLFSPRDSGLPATSQPAAFTSTAAMSQAFGGQGSSDPPVRQMVMPDRMRWVYLDPQGSVQGPFTGVEMNDWYKANFFSPDLRVRKVEDAEFEPLGQLIRKIGNSREPFLVPQIGIPHGPPSGAGQFAQSNATGIVPPLSQVMPSFGRTLTAEEQNNLERRKQEEQVMMVQQRDFIMRQQMLTRVQLGPGVGTAPGSLHHHSSAHSLQSQPSFGSMTSPVAIQQPQAPIGAISGSAGFFEAQISGGPATGIVGAPPMADMFREEELASLNPAERQTLVSLQPAGAMPSQYSHTTVGPTADLALRSHLPGTEQLADDGEGFRERLRQFERLRAEHEKEAAAQMELMDDSYEDEGAPIPDAEAIGKARRASKGPTKADKKVSVDETLSQASLSLTQQVQKAQAAKAVTVDLPMPFPPPPPPQSGTPLPAPTAQRVRSNLPEQYSRSRSETPETTPASAQPPPLAPWAGTTEAHQKKGPSLKEIQEAEARQAAKQEAAAAARRAQVEHEAQLREREKAVASATGLATTSTWGNSSSPVSATSPWTKPAAAKSSAQGASGGAAAQNERRKTLAEIQREEEARKMKQREVAVQTGAVLSAGKRYADLASKTNATGAAATAAASQAATAAAAPGGGWATVGAGGKVKIPTGPAAQGSRSASATVVKTAAAAASKPTLKQTAPSASATKAGPTSEAQQEFRAWLVRELGRGLNDNVNVEDFASTLIELPLEASLIAEAVYGFSKVMNGNHFAEEFIRRKRLADRGVISASAHPSSTTTSAVESRAASSSGGGWSEVAKKGGHGKDVQGGQGTGDVGIPGVGFKVVSGRKKGKK